MTPTKLFYRRDHRPVPEVYPTSYRLMASGMVEGTLEVSLARILNQFPSVRWLSSITLQNTRHKVQVTAR